MGINGLKAQSLAVQSALNQLSAFEAPTSASGSGAADAPASLAPANADLFDESTVRRMADHWRTLLSAAAARPDAPVADLELMSATERALVTGEFCRSSPDAKRGTRGRCAA